MSADRELLELAAKAAGVCLHVEVTHSYGNWGCDTTCVACGKEPSSARWNPLTDDGDALRLAVKLEMEVTVYSVCVDAQAYGKNSLRENCEIGSNLQATTRRAIVRAAAEVGKGMLSHDEFVLMFPDRFEPEEVERARAAAEIGKAMP